MQSFNSGISIPLVVGQPYFTLMFADEELHIPVIQTLLYIDSGVLEDGTPCFFFYEVSSDDSKFFIRQEDASELLLDSLGLLQRLKACFADG